MSELDGVLEPGSEAAPVRSVRERLIEAGEKLFAEHGWNGVSIRTIAAAAGVSLAALNYHFGVKEHLLAEIFAAQRHDGLDLSGPAFAADASSPFGGRVFARLRARLATEHEEFSRRILADAFDESSRRYVATLSRLLPGLPEGELAWRFHFMLGTMVYTMADSGRIQALTGGACDPGDVETALSRLVPFLAAGFRAVRPDA